MIISPHIITGAAIGSRIRNPGLIIVLGILSHIILDHIVHWDYKIDGVVNFLKTGDFRLLLIDLVKLLLDFSIGIIIVFLIARKKNLLNSKYLPYIALGAFAAILPDIVLFGLSILAPENISESYLNFNKNFLHTRKHNSFTFLNVATQIITIIVAGTILLFKKKKKKA